MARILIATSHLLGGVHGATSLAKRLAACGHEMHFACPDEARAVPEHAGFAVHAIPQYPLNPFTSGLPRPGLRGRLPRARRARREAAVARFAPDVFAELLDRLQPDLVLIDAELHAHVITALGQGRRAALLTMMLPGLPGPASPPMTSARVPGPGLRGAATSWALWTRHWAWKRRMAVKLRLSEGGADVASALRAHARAQGVPLGRETTSRRFPYPFAWRRVPLLVLQAQALDLPVRTPPNVRYLGPMTDPDRREDPAADQAAAPAEARGAPLVYIAFGSMLAPPAGFAERLWQAVGTMPEIEAVFVRGRMTDDALPDRRPANLQVLDWAPQPALLRRSALCISRTGINTLVECVEAETRMLLYPGTMTDQQGNAARVLHHGIGHVGRISDDAATIARSIAAALADAEMARRIAEMRAAFRRCEEAAVAEREIERLLAEPPLR